MLKKSLLTIKLLTEAVSNGKTIDVVRTIEVPREGHHLAGEDVCDELDVTFTISGGSDGIGSYEYWGSRGYDHGSPTIDDVTFDNSTMTPNQAAAVQAWVDARSDNWADEFGEFFETDEPPEHERDER